MAPKPTGKGKYYKIPGTVKLLFETPSGFAIFTFDEKYLKKSIEHIWIFFVGDYWHNNILWLHEFRAFEDKPNVFNLTAQTIDVSLVKMLQTYCGWDETLVVGSREYKDIIEKRMGLKCLFDGAVKEVMWGLQNLMHTLVPQEQSKITKDDRLPMSLGLNMVLNRHKINITQEMLNECIIKKTSKVYDTDLHETAHLKFLHKMFDQDFKEFSKVDSKYWNLSKLATALKIMFDPDGALKFGNPHKMFSPDELTAIRRDAHLYQQTLDKDLILAAYDNVVTLREDKAELLYELRSLVEEAKAALETEEVQEKPATNGVDSKKQVDRTCVTVDLAVPNQCSFDEPYLHESRHRYVMKRARDSEEHDSEQQKQQQPLGAMALPKNMTPKNITRPARLQRWALLVLFVANLSVVLGVAVSGFFCIFCSSGICEYCLRFPAQHRLTDNLLHI